MAIPSTSLISSSKTSDSRLSVQLHPLAILTISDYITRHVLRQHSGPIVGAILGAQHGREITMENAFECKIEADADGQAQIDAGWFHDRLQQFKDVHKVPPLDFVGWFTLTAPSGPNQDHLAIHNQISRDYNESALLLAFHPGSVADGSSQGGRLPFTVYESVYEAGTEDGDDRPMQASGDANPLVLRFKELPYSIETGDAEMIGVDFVARGGANAAQTQEPRTAEDVNGKGKHKIATNDAEEQITANALSTEEEEMISSLKAKANAIRMLQQRIGLIKTYLSQLPPCYLNDRGIEIIEPNDKISHTILRSIASMLARLSLLTPSTPHHINSSTELRYRIELDEEAADVALISLLGVLGTTLSSAQTMGKKSGIIESAKAARNKSGAHGMMGGYGQMSGDGDIVDEGFRDDPTKW